MKKAVVIIVTYNGMKWLQECLASVYNSSIPVEVVVIDNNSSDETVNFIKSTFPNVILFEQNENLGFGKANNMGMVYALKQNADFVFLLNQDAFINDTTIDNLIKTSLCNPEYGVLSPIQLDYSGKLLEYYFFKFMSNDVTKSFYSDFVITNPLKEIYDIDFVQAAAWLLPKKTLLEIGGFDPIFFHYGEDDNYCFRVLYHNFKIGVVPNSFIRHDSYEKPRRKEKPFYEDYLKIYILAILVKYCNINLEFNDLQIRKEKRKIYKAILINLVNLNFSICLGLLKKLKSFNSSIIKIRTSRKINKQIGSNHLHD
ncbi:glycosyltransferase family 2 protein [Mariniflexile sp.]|uniref:glycosyltransferase family 2 protein n=1 Tax=Mariniflexile sp. TaxID=1979402 RepID=UPI004048126D